VPTRDIILIGGSSGAIESLLQVVRQLPPDIPAAVFVAIHIAPKSNSLLPKILGRACKIPAMNPKDGTPVQHGQIYVAPPNFHLLLHNGFMRVTRGPKENNHRPAIDPLFRSAALYYGARSIGVLLSGSLDDGAAGLRAIKQRGGLAIVQDPEDALFPDMPRHALSSVAVDYVLPAAQIAPLLSRLAHDEVLAEAPSDSDMSEEIAFEELEMAAIEDEQRPGSPSGFACPDCGGTLWELEDEFLRFRCRVGHGYTAEALLAQQNDGVEAVLWSALRALEENASLSRRVAQRAAKNNRVSIKQTFEAKAKKAEEQARIIRSLIVNQESPGERNPPTKEKTQ
jgi:two-component system, chemotaxis family, protein-glutamate methylesterase/glutaminase